jgi:hypothetical protein
MRVGGYTLDLYCDNIPDERQWLYEPHKGVSFPMQYYGQGKRECIALARRNGWRLGKRDICPYCAKKQK